MCPVPQRRTTHVYVFRPFTALHSTPDQILRPNTPADSGRFQTDDQIRFESKDGNLVCACLSASSSSPENSRPSDLCHNLSAHSHSLRPLIYISQITSGPRCRRSGPATPLPPGSLHGSPSSRPCFPWMSSICILFHFSSFSCAPSSSASCPFHYLSIYSSSNHFSPFS